MYIEQTLVNSLIPYRSLSRENKNTVKWAFRVIFLLLSKTILK